MLKNRKLSEKFKRMPTIDHLWEIKEVEYSNLMELINKEKQLLNSGNSPDSNFRHSRSKSNNQNGFDLTFSKDKKFI